MKTSLITSRENTVTEVTKKKFLISNVLNKRTLKTHCSNFLTYTPTKSNVN